MIYLPIEQQICSQCNLLKEASEFYVRKGSKTGLRTQCIECFQKHRHQKKASLIQQYQGDFSRDLPPFNQHMIDKFWQQVEIRNSDECWLWKGRTIKGYGRIPVKLTQGLYVSRYAHRIAYFLTYGPFNYDLMVCHKCDTPLCCNAKSHLFLGTSKDNQQDAARKLRLPIGSNHKRSKLKEEQVVKIREMSKLGQKSKVIANEFLVSEELIYAIINRKIWRHI